MKGLYNIFRTTSSQAVREPIFLIVTGIFACLVYSTQYLVMFVFSGQTRVVMETGIASISSCGVLLSLLLSWILIRKEMERMSILSVLSKPVSRFSFVTGKYLGILYAVVAAICFLFLVFLFNLWQMDSTRMLEEIQAELFTEFTDDGASTGFLSVVWHGTEIGLKHFFRQWLVPSFIGTVPAVLIVMMVLSICTVSSLYLNVLSTTGITISFLVLGSLSGNVYHVLSEQGTVIASTIGWGIHLLIPDLLRLNIATDVGSRLTDARWELFAYFGPFLAWAVVSCLLYTGMVLTAGSALFQRTEIQ